MPGINLATAYYELVPSMKGAQKAVTAQLSPALVAAGRSQGRILGSGITRAMGSAIKGTATATVGTAAAFIGTAMTKGFGRLRAIDDAQNKLGGLGHSTREVQKIMTDALASVRGTAFGMDEAATTAASVVAAGIKPGADLQRVLKTVADTATIAGTSMGDMGLIFGSVAARGKLQGDDLMQLQSRGVPVLAFLAKTYGITAKAASKMVSKGQIDFAHFAKAMQTNLSGAAVKAGDTFSGSLANLGASISRIGADMLGGVFPKIAPAFRALTGALAPAEDMAGKLGAKIGAVLSPAMDKAVGWVTKLASGTSGLKDTFSGMSTVLGPALAAFTALGVGGLGKMPFLKNLVPGLRAVSGPIGLVTAAILGLVATSPELRAAFGSALQQIFAALSDALGRMSGVTSGLAPALTMISTLVSSVLVSGLKAVVPAAVTLIGVLAQIGSTVMPPLAAVAGEILGGLGTALQTVFGYLTDHQVVLLAALGAFVAWRAVMAGIGFGKLIAGLVTSTASFVTHTAAVIADKSETLALRAMYAGDFIRSLALGTVAIVRQTAAWVASTAVQAASLAAQVAVRVAMMAGAVATGIATAAQWAFNTAMSANPILLVATAIAALVTGLVFFFTQTKLGRQIWSGFVGFLTDTWNNIMTTSSRIFGAIGRFFASFWHGLETLFDVALAVISAWFMNWTVYGIIISHWGQILKFFGSIPAKIETFFSDAIDWLNRAGVDIVVGFLNGARSFFGNIGTSLVQINSEVTRALAGAGEWLFDSGRQIVQGLINGVTSLARVVGRFFLNSLPGWIRGPFEKALGIHSPSRVFYADGVNVVKGLINGVSAMAPAATKRSKQLADSLSKTVSDMIAKIGQEAAQPKFSVADIGIARVNAQIKASAKALTAAINRGLSAANARPLAAQITAAAKLAQKQLTNLRAKINTSDLKALSTSLAGSVDDMKSAMSQLIVDMQKAGVAPRIVKALTVQEKALTTAMTQRAKITDRLSAAQDNLNSLLQSYQQQVASVTSAIQDYANIATMGAVGAGDQQTVTLQGMIDQYTQAAHVAQTFTSSIAALKSRGLSSDLINQLISAGPGQAAAQVQALLGASAAQIAQINAVASQVLATGGALGNLSATNMYGQGIASAQALVKGLQSQQDALTRVISTLSKGTQVLTEKGMKTQGIQAANGLIAGLQSKQGALISSITAIGKSMLAAFKKVFDIHSPSRVMAQEVGLPIVQGIGVGMLSGSDDLADVTDRIAQVAMPTLASNPIVPASQAAQSGDLLTALIAEVRALRDEVKSAALAGADRVGDAMRGVETTRMIHDRAMAGSGGI